MALTNPIGQHRGDTAIQRTAYSAHQCTRASRTERSANRVDRDAQSLLLISGLRLGLRCTVHRVEDLKGRCDDDRQYQRRDQGLHDRETPGAHGTVPVRMATTRAVSWGLASSTDPVTGARLIRPVET